MTNKTDASTDSRTWLNGLNVVAVAVVYFYSPETFTPEVAAYWLTGKGIANIAMGFFAKNGVKLS